MTSCWRGCREGAVKLVGVDRFRNFNFVRFVWIFTSASAPEMFRSRDEAELEISLPFQTLSNAEE